MENLLCSLWVKFKNYCFVFCCDRSVYFTYESTVKVKGIKLYRFIAPKELYLSGYVREANKGFCVPSNKCLPTGLLNVSRCQPQSKSSLLALFISKLPRESSEILLPQLRSQVLSLPVGVLLESWERERREIAGLGVQGGKRSAHPLSQAQGGLFYCQSLQLVSASLCSTICLFVTERLNEMHKV